MDLKKNTQHQKKFVQFSSTLTIPTFAVAIISVTVVNDTGPYHWVICLILGLTGVACGVRGKSPLWADLAGLSGVFPPLLAIGWVITNGFV